MRNAQEVGAVFLNRIDAERARDDLVAAGFSARDIEVRMPPAPAGQATLESVGTAFTTVTPGMELRARGNAGLGVLIGGGLGCLIGALVGSGAFGTGVLLGGGGAGGLVSAIIGLVIGGALGGFIGWGFGADVNSFYARELKSGRTVLIVRNAQRAADAAAILRRHNGWGVNTPPGVAPGAA